jgi:hypothetical protein
LNHRYFGQPLDTPGYKGDPSRPFPWLTWNNRPYVSELELMLVPILSSSRLLARDETIEHKYYAFPKPGEAPRPYQPDNDPEAVPYPHLMNFFHSTSTAGANPHNSPQFHRLLQFVHVPSRFVGTQVQTDPQLFAGGDHWFHPPYHNISQYREPGRINLNTIFQDEVWQGLMNYFPGMADDAFWKKFVQSRRGYGAASDSMLSINPALPTRFGQPFRSATAANMVPLPAMAPDREVNATLLRADPADNETPLFDYKSTALVDETDRNPYFRYQGLQRLGNLVTTRSNVYAIWVTVGYFEVEPVPQGNPSVAAVYPDGYRLMRELGSDTGEIKRHRGFSIYDRSIPVGFLRGQELNVEKGFLLKRFIE